MGRGQERAESALVDSTLQLYAPIERIHGRHLIYVQCEVTSSYGIEQPCFASPHIT